MNKSIAVMLALFATATCRSSVNSQKHEHPSLQGGKVEGVGPLKLGAGFSEAIAATSSVAWSSVGLSDCARSLHSGGCMLPQYGDAPFVRVDGIPLSIALLFNSDGALTDIDLIYREDGKTTTDACLAIFNRLVDALAKDYGPLAASAPLDKSTVVVKTPRGNSYPDPEITDSFVTYPMRTHIESVRLPTDRPIDQWGSDSYVSLLGYGMQADYGSTCRILQTYTSEPTVKRGDFGGIFERLKKVR